MKFTSKHWNIILTVVLTALIIYGYIKTQDYNTLADTVENLEQNMEDQRKENEKEIQTLQEEIDPLTKSVNSLEADLWNLKNSKEDINKKSNEEKSRINRINDADSLRRVFAERYNN